MKTTTNKEIIEISVPDPSIGISEEFIADVSPYFQLKWDNKQKKWIKVRF